MNTTLLTEDQIWGNQALDVMKKYGTRTALTDLAIVLGGLMGRSTTTSEGERSGYIWSASAFGGIVRTVTYGGSELSYPRERKDAVRPALPPSETCLLYTSPSPRDA